MATDPERERRRTLLACPHPGCRSPRLTGEKTCFDHLDLDELEAAINAGDSESDDADLGVVAPIPAEVNEELPAPPAPQEVGDMPRRLEKYPCQQGCGRDLTSEGRRAQHELGCKGKQATSGRIAAASRAVALPVSRPQVRRQNRKRSNGHAARPVPAAVAAIAAAATDKATEIVIAGLTAKRDLIDKAIAALQAVA